MLLIQKSIIERAGSRGVRGWSSVEEQGKSLFGHKVEQSRDGSLFAVWRMVVRKTTSIGCTSPGPLVNDTTAKMTPMEDPLDQLVSSLAAFDPFARSGPILVLNVDRKLSRHEANSLSYTPGGKWTVVVYDRMGHFLKAYDNIHAPKAYINKIKSVHPGCRMCYMLTTTYERKMMSSR